jgi:hypothetical protein
VVAAAFSGATYFWAIDKKSVRDLVVSHALKLKLG